jgi:hypothetical protein
MNPQQQPPTPERAQRPPKRPPPSSLLCQMATSKRRMTTKLDIYMKNTVTSPFKPEIVFYYYFLCFFFLCLSITNVFRLFLGYLPTTTHVTRPRVHPDDKHSGPSHVSHCS